MGCNLTLWFVAAPWSMARCVNSLRMLDWAKLICLSGASDLRWASPNVCPVRVWSLMLETHEDGHRLNTNTWPDWKQWDKAARWRCWYLCPVCSVNPRTGAWLLPPTGSPQSGHLDCSIGFPHYGTIQKHTLFYFLNFSMLREKVQPQIKIHYYCCSCRQLSRMWFLCPQNFSAALS